MKQLSHFLNFFVFTLCKVNYIGTGMDTHRSLEQARRYDVPVCTMSPKQHPRGAASNQRHVDTCRRMVFSQRALPAAHVWPQSGPALSWLVTLHLCVLVDASADRTDSLEAETCRVGGASLPMVQLLWCAVCSRFSRWIVVHIKKE